ncbi:unnamed protein product [Cylicocyclus nassatus]|uniref:Helicase ATP-binding domain-containing protein n=1 Tax=Cylicocyclus nassatus TaxID=53992 RepID=A0AA36M1E8_CYLNA|nr:unnamed protein product [Cylicocyclus nassatus]
MLSGRFAPICKIFPVYQASNARLHLTSAIKSIGRYAKLQKKKDQLSAYPPEFRAKLSEWPRLLQAEIDEGVAHLKELKEQTDLRELEHRGLLIASLRLISDDLHPITGRTVVLKRTAPGNTLDRSKIFRAGAPLTIRDANSLREIAECVMLSSTKKEITVKIRPSSSSKSLTGDTDYVITLSQSSGALHSVQDFFLENKAVDTPGVQLLGYAFRAKNMPSIHNDRMLSDLPEELNESQRRAVSAALNKKRPFVTIQGPPGTGKTRVVAEIVRQLYMKKQKALVCAPSHVAVDKVMSEVLKCFAEPKDLEDSDISDVQNEVVANAETIEEAITSNDKYMELCDIFDKMNVANSDERAKLKKEASRLKWKILKEAYKKRLVIFCTLTSSAIQRLAQVNWHPDVIIIDEAAQASEPVAWAAIVQARRCVLAGDHAQLPSTVVSTEAYKGGLHISLMERLVKEFANANINQLLTVQYRMNGKIMQWSSYEFYDCRLIASENVAKITLSDISLLDSKAAMNDPLIMINTDLCRNGSKDMYKEERSQMSYKNRGEAQLVFQYLQILKNLGIPPKEIAVISPYYAQVAVIREMMGCDVAVNTVDSFQGQEREVVVFTMVRHNEEKSIGFLHNEKRLNVAITRAKRQFVLIGSARMMGSNRHLRSLFRTIREVGKVYGPGVMEDFGKEVAASTRKSSSVIEWQNFEVCEIDSVTATRPHVSCDFAIDCQFLHFSTSSLVEKCVNYKKL